MSLFAHDGNHAPGPYAGWPALVVAAAGIAVCLLALTGFLLTIFYNNLFWYPGLTAQEHYLAVGESYSQGFLVGFFLCFFLILVAFNLSAWIEKRRARSAVTRARIDATTGG